MTAMRLHRYPSPSGGIALGKMGVGATLMWQSQLPPGARWVEYLESTGTQWIDTGVSPYGRMPKVIIDFTMKSTGGGIFGTWGANNTRFQVYRSNYASTGSIGIGSYVNVNWTNDLRYSVVLDAAQLSASLNETVYSGFSANNGFANYNMYLFWRNNNNGDGTRPIPMLCYSCKIWDGNTLVRDLIPVRIGVVGAMYDRRGVGGMNSDGSARTDGLYFNRGTGDFVLGPDTNAPAT